MSCGPNYNPNGITLAQAIAVRDALLAAITKLASMQEYTITNGSNMRKVTRADLKDLSAELKTWEAKVKALTPGARRRIRYGVPLG